MDEREKIFEGFLCSGTMWQVFIRDIKDLDKANKRYLADFSANGGEQREALTEMLREGVEIDWPTNRSQTRIIWAKIVAEEQMIGKGTSIGDLNRGLRIKRVMRYSRTRVEEALKEASREGLKKGGV